MTPTPLQLPLRCVLVFTSDSGFCARHGDTSAGGGGRVMFVYS